MDSRTCSSDTSRVSTGGLLRWRLANSLRSAYAVGLLTHDTFAHRIDHLYGGPLVNPDQLVGDLAFRRRGARRAIRQAFTDLASRWRRDPDDVSQLPILALDWSGSALELLVGRGSHCDLVILDRAVSRRHAHLFFREGRWILVDLDSTNGTYINGNRVQRSELLPGDVIAFGAERLRVD